MGSHADSPDLFKFKGLLESASLHKMRADEKTLTAKTQKFR
jgi:hypothetical protein